MIKCELLKLSFVWGFNKKIACRLNSNIFGHSNIILCNEIKINSFLTLTSDSVTLRLGFLLLSISATISPNTTNILRYLPEL